uniref:Uncharacterized protein n=1 Tax=Rhizophora mucronata TaxID=61149 RepID=A0A2P2IP34_RHIMU
MNWVQRKIYLYNVTFGLFMLDWWERYLFSILFLSKRDPVFVFAVALSIWIVLLMMGSTLFSFFFFYFFIFFLAMFHLVVIM